MVALEYVIILTVPSKDVKLSGPGPSADIYWYQVKEQYLYPRIVKRFPLTERALREDQCFQNTFTSIKTRGLFHLLKDYR